MNNYQLMKALSDESYKWISRQRLRYILFAKGLNGAAKEPLEPYFESDLLGTVRIAQVNRIDNPPFYRQARLNGVRRLLDFRQMAGITFVDCILIARSVRPDDPFWNSLLFHELVHVVQYRLLGVRGFIEQYLAGWMNTNGRYEDIPLERQAYALQRLFEQGHQFSVEEKLKKGVGCRV